MKGSCTVYPFMLGEGELINLYREMSLKWLFDSEMPQLSNQQYVYHMSNLLCGELLWV